MTAPTRPRRDQQRNRTSASTRIAAHPYSMVVGCVGLVAGLLCGSSSAQDRAVGKPSVAEAADTHDPAAIANSRLSIAQDLPEHVAVDHARGEQPVVAPDRPAADSDSPPMSRGDRAERTRHLVKARPPVRSAALGATIDVPWYRTGLGALAIVLVSIGAITWWLRRFSPQVRVSESKTLRVVARTGVAPKHSAALIQLGSRYVLVGISGERMTTLTEVIDPEEAALLSQRLGAGRGGTSAFAGDLVAEAAGFRREPSPEGEHGLQALRGRLRSWRARHVVS